MRRIIIAAITVFVLGAGVFTFVTLHGKTPVPASIPEPINSKSQRHTIIGQSVEGRNIDAYTYGTGETELLFVGGIHGGYEWNTVLEAYQFIDYLAKNPDNLPKNLTITVIPSANPDGVYRVTGKTGRFALSNVTIQQKPGTGRFNARGVDLNRNFDCKWKPKSTWQQMTVSAGSKVFSEPETIAIRDFVLKEKPTAAIFWHSQANAVYTSECEAGILPATQKIADVYAQASGYKVIKSFDNYEISGDAEGWLASINIPAITVELKSHEDIEWEKNLSGIEALFKYYGQETKKR